MGFREHRHAKRRGAAWGNRGYAEIAAIELQREKFVVDSGERHRVPGSADRPGRVEDVAPGGSIDLNGHRLAVVGRETHCPPAADRRYRRQGRGQGTGRGVVTGQ